MILQATAIRKVCKLKKGKYFIILTLKVYEKLAAYWYPHTCCKR
jgi:hypothetical protein